MRNAGKDTRDVESALKAVNFNVTSGDDLDHARTLQLLNRFRTGLHKGDVVVVYFAGHGISMANSNLLLPIDFEKAYARNPGLARQKSVDMEQSIATMLKGAGVRFPMIVADACREVPQIPADSRSIQRGLAAPREVASGTLILYAAAAVRAPPAPLHCPLDWPAAASAAFPRLRLPGGAAPCRPPS